MENLEFLLKFLNENWKGLSFLSMLILLLWRARGWVSSVDSRLTVVDSRLTTVEKGLKEILDLFLKRGSPVAEGNSPLTLTDLGKEIAKELHALEWAREQTKTLAEEILGKQSYEIEEFCFQYMRGQPVVSEEMNQRITKVAYEKGIARRDVLDVLALELRDELIAYLHK